MAYGRELAQIALNRDSRATKDQQLRALKQVQKALDTADVRDAEQNLGDMDDQDLKAQLFEAARRRCMGDEGLFLTLCYEVFQAKPHLWKQLQADPPVNAVIEVKVEDEP
jgi:hypothetical protein